MAKVLITGANGFVGSHLVRDFLSKHHKVHIIIRPNSNLWRLEGIISKLTKHTLDLRQNKALNQLLRRVKPNIIIHTAAAGIYRNRHLPEKQMLEHNTLATLNLINAASSIPYRAFIHTGSSSEYGPKDTPMSESDKCFPQNMYALSKLAATQAAQLEARTKKKPIVILRLFSPYGPNDDPRRLIPYAIRQAVQNKALKLAKPSAVRDYIYIDDVIKAYHQAIKYAKKYKGEIFNIGSGTEIKTNQVIKEIMKITQSKTQVLWGEETPSTQDSSHWRANITKAKRLLKWAPKFNVARGVAKTLQQLES